MLLETITLAHNDAVEQLRRRYGHEASSHAFLSLFLWKEEMGLRLYLTPNMFAVKCMRRGEECWFFPCGDQDAIIAFLHHQLTTHTVPLRLCYMRQEDVALLNREFPGRFMLTASPDDDEYLYDSKEQIFLQGKAFRHHRNALNRLKRKYQIEIQEISVNNLKAASCIFERAQGSHVENDDKFSMLSAEQNLLKGWEKLGMNGVIAYADGKPAAIAAGYMISDRMYDISVCRQVLNDPDIAVYVRHQLFVRIPKEVELINAEEDLGLEGLRTLKQGMRPVGRLTMFEGVSR